MKREFLTASPVDVKDGCADKARISLEQAERLSILSEGFEKAPRLLSRELDHAHFCDHDRPAENRADGESQQDDLPSDGGMLKSEKEPAAREEFREQNRRQVEQLVMRFLKRESTARWNTGFQPVRPAELH